MTLDDAVDRLAAQFAERPLDYTVEHALVCDLHRFVDAELGTEVRARGSYESKDVTRYKRPYVDAICREQTIRNVQVELNVGEPGRNRRIDLAVLREPADAITVKYVNGSKYYPASAVEHAVEVKFIKNQDLPNPAFGDPESDDWADLDRDLEKLTALREMADSRRLVVASNKNLFQQGEADPYNRDARHRLGVLRGECARRGIELTTFYPRPD